MRRFELVSRLEFMFENFVGRSMQHFREQVAPMLGKEVPAHWQREFQLRTTAALEAEVQAVHGIDAVLESLDVPYCVASAAATRLCLEAGAHYTFNNMAKLPALLRGPYTETR